MKAQFNGISCGRLKHGDICEIEILGPMKVKAWGENFTYTFTYYEEDYISKVWSFIDEGKSN